MDSSTSVSPEIARADVLVVGAGPAGSATALLLAGFGHSVVMVDRASFPRDKACSEYMSPEAVRILDRLGVVVALEQAGAVPLAGSSVTAADGARLQGRFALAGHRPFRPTGLSVSRRILDHRLLESARAAGVRVLERTTVETLLHDAGGIAGALVRLPGGSPSARTASDRWSDAGSAGGARAASAESRSSPT
jgi:2-polyprenyl-6-methoxyphenol hydroxylase-like FAD-dependent oxidoreductase